MAARSRRVGVGKPAAWMLLASALFACQGALVKLGFAQFGAFELVFYRNLVVVLLMLGLVAVKGLDPRTPLIGAQLRLGAWGAASMVLYFLALAGLHLGTATALNYSAPLFLALLLWGMGLRRPGALALGGVALGFAGVLVLLRPSWGDPGAWSLWFGLLSGAAGGVAYLLLSRLRSSTEPPWRINLYFSLIAAALSGAFAWAQGFASMTWPGAALILAVGLAAAIAQWATVQAYASESPLLPATFSYCTVVFSALLGSLVLGESLASSAELAIALVVLGGLGVSIEQARAGTSALWLSKRRRSKELQ